MLIVLLIWIHLKFTLLRFNGTLKIICKYSWADATVNMNYITGAVDQECAADLMARVAINR